MEPISEPVSGSRVYYRLNPSGHKEQVIRQKGKLDDATLNELAADINHMLEAIEMGANPSLSAETPMPYRFTPQLVTGRGESHRINGDTITNMSGSTPLQGDLDEAPEDSRTTTYNAGRSNKHKSALLSGDAEEGELTLVHLESFTGTAGIAIAPIAGTLGPIKSRKSRKLRVAKPNGTWEHNMRSDIDRLLNEWEPEFKAGEYDPGEHYMDHHGGEGVAGRKAKKAKGSSGEMKNHGEPFGASHNETPAMCDVEENGVENKPQGDHESSVGDPMADDCCDEVGHNWPDQPRHKGGGVAEPVAGNRYSDGGQLHGASMEWSPARIGKLMGEEVNLQRVFNAYARANKVICLEGFADLCEAHGIDVDLDHTSLLRLMADNKAYMFYEHVDADGVYFMKRPISESQHGADPYAIDHSGSQPGDEFTLEDNPNPEHFDEGDIEHQPRRLSRSMIPKDELELESDEDIAARARYNPAMEAKKKRGKTWKESLDMNGMGDESEPIDTSDDTGDQNIGEVSDKPHSVTIDGVEYVPADQSAATSPLDEYGDDGEMDEEMMGGEDDEMGGEVSDAFSPASSLDTEDDLAEEGMPKSLLKHFKEKGGMGKKKGKKKPSPPPFEKKQGGCY